MKLKGNNFSTLVWFLLLGMVIGSLGWEVLERALSQVGVVMSVSVGPVGVDLAVVAFSMLINPGTFLGVAGSILLFRAL